MKKLCLILPLILCSISGFSQNNEDLHQFDWLIGQWKGVSEQGTFYEVWEEKDKITLLGLGSFVKNGDTLFEERLQIQKIAGYWCYIAAPSGKRPVLFSLVSVEKNQWVFENPEHDFPQQISYTHKPEGYLTAITSGKEKGREKQQKFEFKKMP